MHHKCLTTDGDSKIYLHFSHPKSTTNMAVDFHVDTDDLKMVAIKYGWLYETIKPENNWLYITRKTTKKRKLTRKPEEAVDKTRKPERNGGKFRNGDKGFKLYLKTTKTYWMFEKIIWTKPEYSRTIHSPSLWIGL